MNLRLLQIADSALPIGGYSQSWGLEAAIHSGLVRDAPTLEIWTRCYLRESLGPFEGIIVGNVVRDPDLASKANELLVVSMTPPTLRHASREMGGQLASLAERWDWAKPAIKQLPATPHHAIVFALLAGVAGASAQEAVSLFLHQAAVGVISAGVRGVPIGHTHGQQVLARLHDDIAEVAATYYDKPLETAGSSCPALEILCHEQSRLYSRIFRS